MGWNHALDIAHNAFANIVADSLQTNVRDLLVDGQKPPNINSGIPIVYVDNFVFLSSSPSQVSHAVSCVAARCAEVGLPTHELVSCSRQLKVLGWEIDGEARTLRPARVRAWRLYFALDQAIACGKLSSKQLEVIIGHFTFVAMARRCCLATMNAVYSYIRKNYKKNLVPCGQRRLES